eukprot:scaffold44750_cov54-Phaeocystis_antarctica.AAC.6
MQVELHDAIDEDAFKGRAVAIRAADSARGDAVSVFGVAAGQSAVEGGEFERRFRDGFVKNAGGRGEVEDPPMEKRRRVSLDEGRVARRLRAERRQRHSLAV